MTALSQKRLLVCLLGIAVVGVGIFAVEWHVRGGNEGEGNSMFGYARTIVFEARVRYSTWRSEREHKHVERLIGDADIMIVGNGSDRYERSKPAGPDGASLSARGADAIARLTPPKGVCGRNAAVLEVPCEWLITPGSIRCEEYALDAADKLKALGFRKVSIVTTHWGRRWLLFDGGLPSRKEVEKQRRERLEAKDERDQ